MIRDQLNMVGLVAFDIRPLTVQAIYQMIHSPLPLPSLTTFRQWMCFRKQTPDCKHCTKVITIGREPELRDFLLI
jgi:hypothetical protein